MRINNKLTYPEARKLAESTSIVKPNTSYADAVKNINEDTCSTCKIIIDELSNHFPEVADAILKKLTSSASKKQESANTSQTQPNSTSLQTPKQTVQNKLEKRSKQKTPPKTKQSSQEKEKTVASQTKKKKEPDRPKISRYEVQVSQDSTDVVVASIPVSANRYGELEDMDAEHEPPGSKPSNFKPPNSWDDSGDEM